MTDGLGTLLIERSIAHAHALYAEALDSRQWHLLDQIFAPECIARYGDGPELSSRTHIIAAIRSYLDPCGPTQHLIGNLIVDQAEGDFISRAQIRAAHKARTGDALFWSLGAYHARWRQQDSQLQAVEWQMAIAFNSGDKTVFDPCAEC